MEQRTFCELERTMGPDRDSEELIDAVGKRMVARECDFGRDNPEYSVIRKRAAASEQSERRSEDRISGQGVDLDFDER